MQEVVSVQGDHERLVYVQKIIKELPTPHFRWTSLLSALFFFLSNCPNYCHVRLFSLIMLMCQEMFIIHPQDSGVPY